MNKIRITFKPGRSDRSPLTACKSVFKKGLYALALTGLSLPFANSAFALSAGCTGWNISTTNNGVVASNQAFGAWEVAKVTFTHVSGTSPNNYTYTYTDNDNAANSRSATAGSTTTGDTVTLTIQIPADTTNGRLIMHGPGANYNITVTCVAGSPPVAEEEEEETEETKSSASTSSAVVTAVSRSQTTVIQQNIASRVSSVISPTSNLNTDNMPGLTTSARETAPHRSSLIDTTADHDDRNSKSITDRNDALRRMAMMGSFDSSTGQGMQMLGLGPTDQGSIGGASGIDGRSAFATTTPFTVWGHGSFTSVNNDYVNGTNDSRYDGDVWGYNIGLDYRFADALIAGVSLGYNDTDLTTPFNSGSYQETGWVASPYVIYRPIENLTIAGEAGYGMGDIDVTRDNNAVSATTESDIWYAALTTSYRVQPHDTLPVSLTPSVAFMAARKTVDGYTESDGTNNATTRSNTRQIKPAIEAAYDFTPTQSLTITPFLETGLIYDFTDEINNDKTAFNIGGGFRLSESTTGLNAALEGNYLAGRTDYTEYTIGGTVTYGFTLKDDQGRDFAIVSPFFGSDLNEYGHQRMQAGFDFSSGSFTSQIAVEHRMSVASNDDNDAPMAGKSRVSVKMSMPF